MTTVPAIVVSKVTEDAKRSAAGFLARYGGPTRRAYGCDLRALPAPLVVELDRHLAAYAARGADAYVFTSAACTPIERSNFRNRVWMPAVERVGLEGLPPSHSGHARRSDGGDDERAHGTARSCKLARRDDVPARE
jgi:hypothetical protein